MEAPPTYQQLLAEQYAENERERYQNYEDGYEEEEEEDNIEYHITKNYEKNMLENPELFNKHQGDRGNVEIVIPPKDFEDKTRGSVRFNKDVKKHIVNVDSRFRAVPKAALSVQTFDGITETTVITASKSEAFAIMLPSPIKNAVSLKITSISIPNNFYTFSAARENISFDVYGYTGTLSGTVTINEGNYASTQDLVDAIETQLQLIPDVDSPTVFPYHISYDTLSNKIRIFRTGADTFGLDFTPATIDRPFDNGLGYYLGFNNLKYGTAPQANEDDVVVPVTTFSSYTINITAFNKIGSAVTVTTSSTTGIQNGSIITISGGTASSGNKGTFTVISYITDTSITYTNAGGSTETATAIATTTDKQALAESFPETDGDHYIFLGINDFVNIEHHSFNDTFFPAFAKILLPNDSKNKLISDITLQNIVQKEYNFIQPVNLNRMDFTLYDPYGTFIDMKGSNFSITLEIEEVLNQGLYDKLREL